MSKDPVLLHVNSEDSDQTGRMHRLIWVFAGCTGHYVGFVMRWFIYNIEYYVKKGAQYFEAYEFMCI